MGDGFFVSLDSHLDGIASPLGIQRARNELQARRLGHTIRPRRPRGCTSTTPWPPGPCWHPPTLLESSPQRRDRVRADRRVEVAHQQGEPPPLEVGVPPARRHPPEPRRPEVLPRPPAVGREPLARYQPVSVRVFLERPECGTSAARRLEPVGVDELELVGSWDIHQRLAHRRVSVESFSRSPSSYWCTRAAASRPSRC
jgi:hypothetical protein